MPRFSTLRSAAALFACASVALTATPAGAQLVSPGVGSYAAVLQTLNPELPVDKARAYARSIMADAWRTHLDPRFIMSIVTVESRWRANAISRVGARGLGQLMPGTAARLGVDAWNPTDNLRGTSSYLKALMDHFAGKPDAVKLAIAGYNAGPRAVERFHGIPPYAETQNYVTRVLRVWKELNTRIGRAFAPRPAAIAARPLVTPEERQWLTSVNEVVPIETAPDPGTTDGSPRGAAAPAPSSPEE